jgi:hypothetical protein
MGDKQVILLSYQDIKQGPHRRHYTDGVNQLGVQVPGWTELTAEALAARVAMGPQRLYLVTDDPGPGQVYAMACALTYSGVLDANATHVFDVALADATALGNLDLILNHIETIASASAIHVDCSNVAMAQHLFAHRGYSARTNACTKILSAGP